MFEFQEKSKLQKFSTNLLFSAGRPTSSTPTPYYSIEHIQDNAPQVTSFNPTPHYSYEHIQDNALLEAGGKPSTWLPPGRPRGKYEREQLRINSKHN